MSDDISFAFLTVPKVEFGRGKVRIIGGLAAEKLGALGLREIDINDIIRAAMPSGSLKANPQKGSEQDLRPILERTLIRRKTEGRDG